MLHPQACRLALFFSQTRTGQAQTQQAHWHIAAHAYRLKRSVGNTRGTRGLSRASWMGPGWSDYERASYEGNTAQVQMLAHWKSIYHVNSREIQQKEGRKLNPCIGVEPLRRFGVERILGRPGSCLAAGGGRPGETDTRQGSTVR